MSTSVSVLRRPLNRRGPSHYGDKANIVKAVALRRRGNDPKSPCQSAAARSMLFTTSVHSPTGQAFVALAGPQ
jgi:hypothetical protein